MSDRLRLSVYEREIGAPLPNDVRAMIGMRAKGIDIHKVAELKADIILHEVYFSSFSACRYRRSDTVRELFGTEAELYNRLYRMGMSLRSGFIGAFVRRGSVELFAEETAFDVLMRGMPRLALDLCEHAYFFDFGFARENYLTAALPHLDLSLLSPS